MNPAQSRQPAAQVPVRDRLAGPLGAALVALPSRVPVVFFWTTLVVSLAVLLEVFTPIVVLPALVAVVVLTWRAGPVPFPVDRISVRAAGWAVGLAAAWVLVNLWLAGEVLLVQRDPGFLTLAGLWLTENPDPDIPVRSAVEALAGVPGASVVADAFWADGDTMYAQGAKTFPGLIALAGWLAGQGGVLRANVVIGGIALLAVYDLARRLITPRWALVPMVALALGTPFLYFTRTPFTEPTNVALTFGGLAVLHGAFDRARWRFALAGAMVGASALSRIDGASVAAGLVLGLGLVAAGSRDPARRRVLVRGFLAASGTAGLMVVLGYLDVRRHSPGYLADHAWLYGPLVALLAASALAGVVALLLARRTSLPGWLAARGRALGALAGAVVLGVAVVLATRPLWMQRRGIEPGSPQEQFVAAFQRVAGVPVDGTRSYDEMTLTWLAWYLGPITVALAVAGAALMLQGAVRDRRPERVVLLVALGVPALLYLVRPSITPDQVWAMRRFLPAVIPGALLSAAWLLHHTLATVRDRWVRGAAWLATGLMLVSPAATWGTLVTTPEYRGRAGQVSGLCELTRGARVVVVRAVDPPLLPTLRIVCDADVLEVPGPVDRAALARVREAWGGRPVLVASLSGDSLPWPTGQPPTSATPIARWPHTLYPSRAPLRFTSALWVGTVEPDGSVTPLAGAPVAAASADPLGSWPCPGRR